MAVAAHAESLTPVAWNDTAVVVGCGMIGLFVIQVLRTRGCVKIITIDLEDEKLALARKLGADVVFNPNMDNIRKEVEALTEGRGADVVFEVVGISESVKSAIAALEEGASVLIEKPLASSLEDCDAMIGF